MPSVCAVKKRAAVVESLCSTISKLGARRAEVSIVNGGVTGMGARTFGTSSIHFDRVVCRAASNTSTKGKTTNANKGGTGRVNLNMGSNTATMGVAKTNSTRAANGPFSLELGSGGTAGFFIMDSKAGHLFAHTNSFCMSNGNCLYVDSAKCALRK